MTNAIGNLTRTPRLTEALRGRFKRVNERRKAREPSKRQQAEVPMASHRQFACCGVYVSLVRHRENMAGEITGHMGDRDGKEGERETKQRFASTTPAATAAAAPDVEYRLVPRRRVRMLTG